jgi:DNA-binding transcriptional LysR family regulator
MAITTDREDLELSLLRTFLAVVRHGSMGKTAAAVSKTQPAVSQQMSRLEKIIGRKLFSRSRGGVNLTGHGELLVAYATRAVDLNEEALARLREEAASGPVRLGLSEETALAGLTPTLKRFQRTHPVIEWRSRLTWLASTDLSIDPFKTLPLVLCENAGSWRGEILSSLRRAGWDCRVVFEGASLDATLAAVESGLGVSALLRESVRNTGIREVSHARLPVLPEVRFGLFRSRTTATRARALMEAALTASLQAATGNRLPQAIWTQDKTASSSAKVSLSANTVNIS